MRTPLLVCLFLGVLLDNTFALEERACSYACKDEQVQLRHIEGKGIGYERGYTTIEVFFSPQIGWLVPLIDFRGHVFDDGKLAANAGVGLRYLNGCAYGINAYYDYRQTHHFHYNQVSFGFEILGRWLDFRTTLYLPIGKKQNLFQKKIDVLLDREYQQKEEYAFKGGNAELGAHLFGGAVDGAVGGAFLVLYGAVGPYYFDGDKKSFWGGEARLSVTFFEHVRLELSSSYDPVFKGIGQAELSLRYFFGPKTELKSQKTRSCLDEVNLRNRGAQDIDRFEIIAVR